MSSGKLVLIIGPSGVGKSVILQHLREKHPELHFPRSATTRARRKNEGDDLYKFVTDAEFDALLHNDQILEWAVVHGGARYGTLKEEIIPLIDRGMTVVREVDVQGFVSIQNHPLFADGHAPYRLQSIFILPEHKEQLIAHITARAPIDDDELQRRLSSMDKELAYSEHCTAKIVNKEGKLKETLAEVEKIILG